MQWSHVTRHTSHVTRHLYDNRPCTISNMVSLSCSLHHMDIKPLHHIDIKPLLTSHTFN